VRARRLGLALTQLREGAGMSLETAAAEVDLSKSTLSRLEKALTPAKPAIVRALLVMYGVSGDELEALVQLARDSRQGGWWRAYSDVLPPPHLDYLALESEAVRISLFEANLVAGILQTPEYARSVMRSGVNILSDEDIESRVEARQKRGEMLIAPRPPALCAILDEAALRRPVGGPSVMKGQMDHLLKLSQQPGITIQVIPLSVGAHPGLPGPVHILEYEDPSDPPIVALETIAGDMLVDRGADIQHCLNVFAALRSLALSPNQTRDMMRAITHTD
jgi:transcriptional regulator with XRE-family HTH domain